MSDSVKLHPSWLEPLRGEFDSPYMAALRAYLVAEKSAGKRIFPKGNEWFRALDLTPLEQVRLSQATGAFAQAGGSSLDGAGVLTLAGAAIVAFGGATSGHRHILSCRKVQGP